MATCFCCPAQLFPGVAGIARYVQPAAGAAAGELPRPPAGLPEAGEKHVWVGRIEADVGGTGVRILEEYPFPGLAAVLRAIDAAFWVGAEGVAEHRGVGDVRVGRVYDHRAD